MAFLAAARNLLHSSRLSRYCRFGACVAKSGLDASASGLVRNSLEAPKADREVRRALFALGACIGATPVVSWSLCESGEETTQADTATTNDDEEDEEFDFNFAKPPVAPAPLELRFSVQVKPGVAGQRPVSDILVQSVFSLPVERGWPRDKLSPAEVAASMSGVLADRLPRFAADYWDLRLTGAPLQLRGGIDHWPAGDQKPAELRSDYLPEPFPALVSLRRLAGSETGFVLNSATTLTVSCTSLGVRKVDADERLDLELTTRLQDFPVAGWAWGLVGCGGRWWFEKYRLPVLRRLLEAYHQMAHEQMMLFYVAALRN